MAKNAIITKVEKAFAPVAKLEGKEKTLKFAEIVEANIKTTLHEAYPIEKGILGRMVEEHGVDASEMRTEWVKLIMAK